MKIQDPYKKLAAFYEKKAKEMPGGSFFTIHHHKAVSEHGVWGRSKKELTAHLNKIRHHFTSIKEETV